MGSSGLVGGGRIVHSSRGFAYKAKLCAVLYAIEVAQIFSWDIIWLECDSSYVVHLFLDRKAVVLWKFRARFSNCLHYISTIDTRALHIFKDGNCVAHMLS